MRAIISPVAIAKREREKKKKRKGELEGKWGTWLLFSARQLRAFGEKICVAATVFFFKKKAKSCSLRSSILGNGTKYKNYYGHVFSTKRKKRYFIFWPSSSCQRVSPIWDRATGIPSLSFGNDFFLSFLFLLRLCNPGEESEQKKKAKRPYQLLDSNCCHYYVFCNSGNNCSKRRGEIGLFFPLRLQKIGTHHPHPVVSLADPPDCLTTKTTKTVDSGLGNGEEKQRKSNGRKEMSECLAPSPFSLWA